MAGIADVFGEGSTARQLFVWGVLQQVLIALLNPAFTDLQQRVDEGFPVQQLTPTDAADLTARGMITDAAGKDEAAKSGVNAERFGYLVELATQALSTAEAAQAWRLGLVGKGDGDPTSATMTGAFKAAGIREDWWPVMEKLSQAWPTPEQALTAGLVGWFTESDAKTLFQQLGGNPDYFDMLFYSQGSAPTPDELLTLWNRGYIPEDSGDPNKPGYVQGFKQGPWRDMWLPVFEALREYLPPPRTVTAMLKNGSLTVDQATQLLVKQGLSQELAAAYITDAQQSASSADKDLTQSQIIALYGAQLITNSDAESALELLGFDQTNADYLLALADLRREIAALNAAVSRVQSLYVGHKIDRQTAVSALGRLQVPADQVQGIVTAWDTAAAVNVKVLTEAQVADAFKAGLLDQAGAQSELEGQGYTPHDAWVLLSLKMGAALPGEPPPGPANPLTGT